jgi:hypothetical protein
MVDKMCDKHVLSAFCSLLSNACSKKKLTDAQWNALAMSTEHLIGQQLTKKLLVSNAYRVLANFYFIMEGMAIPVWDGTSIEASVVFIGLHRKREQIKDKLYLKVQLKFRNGLSAGIIYWVAFTPRQIQFFLQRFSGCKSLNPAIEEISGMRASLVVELCGEQLKVLDWDCTADEKAYNRQLTEARRNVRKCTPFRPCNTCPKTIGQCPLAIWLQEIEQ